MNTKQRIQSLVLVVGLAGAVAVFATTPKLFVAPNGQIIACEDPRIQNKASCVTDTEGALARGGGVLLLGVLAFMGVGVVFGPTTESEPTKDA
jgi:hypothetical protein